MDGVDFTAPVSGAAWPWPDTDVIEEIEVVSLGASAEHGNSPGAVFNVVTRQGTNVFRGDAAYFGMFDALTAKPIRMNAAWRRSGDGRRPPSWERCRSPTPCGTQVRLRPERGRYRRRSRARRRS